MSSIYISHGPILQTWFHGSVYHGYLSWILSSNNQLAMSYESALATLRMIKISQFRIVFGVGVTTLYLNYASFFIEAIETHRQNEIKKALELIDALIKRYQGPGSSCSTPWYPPHAPIVHDEHARRACNGTILGTLLQSAAEEELYPIPKAPYHGLSLFGVTWSVMKFKISSLCHHKFKPKYTSFDGKESHGVYGALSLQAHNFTTTVQALT